MKVKVSEATGPVLDWMVAKVQGATNLRLYTPQAIDPIPPYWVFRWEAENRPDELANYDPSEDWSLGGPIIEDEGINTFRYNKLDSGAPWVWCAHKTVSRSTKKDGAYTAAIHADGPTPLIAAMRCFVSSKLGDEVDVPEELK